MSWSLCSLDELGSVSRGRSRHRPRDASHLYGGPYPFVQTADVKAANLYLTEYEQTYSEVGLEQSRLWPPGTLCITIAANIAETAILGIEACFPDSIIGFIANADRADTLFVKYMFDAALKMQYRAYTQGAAQDNLSQAKLLALKFSVPDVAEQRRIADVLSAYDDLIENNRRRMALLEAAARQLYREWFVRLRFPGHEHTRIIDGAPEGWEHKPLASLCENETGIQTGPFGSQLHQSDYAEDGIPVIMPRDLVNFTISLDSVARIPEQIAERLDRYRLMIGDTVYGRRGDMGRRAFIGPRQSGYICGTGCLRIRPNPERINPRYLFDALGSPETAGTIASRAKGATMPNLNSTVLKTVPVLVPPRRMQQHYVEQIEPLTAMCELLAELNQRLRTARDLLLPRLMSGEIAV
ncbi:restriction endonuclease subunit S [Thiobaca trueperi]|uniref:Type I restriction enzyme S subunit n=1 Tax=Thiobaca trueperi TaxID=127458 RepID=A0A4R3N1L2_9GAMM|nr:restriction endonuclease subunit S [Thiobaca trueperi]TCT22107.1 type I restriction enzyme S subunit [Thiobaca trueperi]